jgi:hypothetical protein
MCVYVCMYVLRVYVCMHVCVCVCTYIFKSSAVPTALLTIIQFPLYVT